MVRRELHRLCLCLPDNTWLDGLYDVTAEDIRPRRALDMQRPPGANTPLQRAPDAGADLGMPTPDLVEDGDRPQARGVLQQQHHLAVPNATQRIRPPPAA